MSRANDQWSLGTHRLLCADAREQSSYDLLLEGQKAQFVFTDPPYNVAIDGNACGLGRIRHREFVMASGEMTQGAFTGFLMTNFERLAANTDAHVNNFELGQHGRHRTNVWDYPALLPSGLDGLKNWLCTRR